MKEWWWMNPAREDPRMETVLKGSKFRDLVPGWGEGVKDNVGCVLTLSTFHPLFDVDNCFFLFFSSCFLWSHLRHMDVPSLGVKLELHLLPMPQPYQCHFQATSVTYTTAHSSAGSLTHWVSPGIELTSSWILVGFVSTVPQLLWWTCVGCLDIWNCSIFFLDSSFDH